MTDADETDALDGQAGILPPRQNPYLVGHEAAERALLDAFRSERLSHAWLISGPRGIGKATLAYRFARFLLGHGGPASGGLFGTLPAATADTLHVDPDSPLFRRVAAGGHADLMVVERGFTDDARQKLRTEIVVADVRRIGGFLAMTPAEGGWRVVIVDADLTVMECNETLARMFDEDTLSVYQAWPGLAGARLERLVPFAGSFQTVLDTGQDIHRETLRLAGRIFSVAIFSIEPHRLIGGFVLDVTSSEMPRVQIAQLAQEVIRKNLDMVQEIACRLGENMADTEILLRSLADGCIGDGRTQVKQAEPVPPPAGTS